MTLSKSFLATIGLASALSLGVAIVANSTGQETMYDGEIVDTAGKAVMGAMAIGAGDALDKLGKIDTLTRIRVDLVKADMNGELRGLLSGTEQLAYNQALEGEWSNGSLNAWIDGMLVDAALVQGLSETYGDDIRNLNAGYSTDPEVIGLLTGKDETFSLAFDTLLTAETFAAGTMDLESVSAEVSTSAHGPDHALSNAYAASNPDADETFGSEFNNAEEFLQDILTHDPFAGGYVEEAALVDGEKQDVTRDIILRF
jgi:hypothetical protein